MNNTNLAFIGAGNMANSLIRGLLAKKFNSAQIAVSDVNQAQLQKMQNTLHVNIFTDNNKAIENADIVVLAVKPQVTKSVVLEIRETLKKNSIMTISVAAGVREKSISAWIGANQPIIRCMPNTPALIGAGASALYANASTTKQQRSLAETILQTVGTTAWVENEALLDAVTALSGSGPAYFFLLVESMIEAGIKLGLDKKLAENLAQQTAFGAAKMLRETTDTACQLRANVTSKAGTTEAAINTFEAENLRETVYNSMHSAYKRSIELGRQLGEE